MTARPAGRGVVAGQAPSRDPHAIVARWRSRCAYCGRSIERGDLIVLVCDRWLHERCEEVDDG